MATRPLTNASGSSVRTGTNHAPTDTCSFFVRPPLRASMMPPWSFRVMHNSGHFCAGTPILPRRFSPGDLVGLPGARAASLGANLLYSGAGGPPTRPASGRLYPDCASPFGARRIAVVCLSNSETVLVNDVMQNVSTTRAGEPDHEAGAFSRHRVERHAGRSATRDRAGDPPLENADRAGTQIVVPIAHVKFGVFLETEYGHASPSPGTLTVRGSERVSGSSTCDPAAR